MKWIINKKIYAPMEFLSGVCINFLNMTILMIVLDMFLRVIAAKNSKWYNTAQGVMSETDVYFVERADLIYYTLGIVILLLGVFCMSIICLFRKQQADKIENQMGIFRACGYQNNQIKNFIIADGFFDAVIALWIAFGMYQFAGSIISQNPVFEVMYCTTKERTDINLITMLLIGILFFGAISMQALLWVEARKNHDIASMIKEK